MGCMDKTMGAICKSCGLCALVQDASLYNVAPYLISNNGNGNKPKKGPIYLVTDEIQTSLPAREPWQLFFAEEQWWNLVKGFTDCLHTQTYIMAGARCGVDKKVQPEHRAKCMTLP